MTSQQTLLELVQQRRSIRGYRPQRVDEDVLRQIFTQAQRAPSNCNTQPWQVAVVSGERLKKLGQRLSDAMMSGDLQPDFPYDGVYEGIYRERQHASANALYSAMGIAREDKASRHNAFMRNFSFFDAPHAAFFFLPEPFGIREAADLGMYAQTVMLSLAAHGLASCPQTALSFQPHIVREALSLPASWRLLFGLSFGYPDPSHASAKCETDRAAIDTAVRFYE
ncbi:nitroreductase [Litorivivens sp.]|uniref:nitroreductase n=1 Tax=Litorivivens sp. TaxID=2020868 RepID=UPI0035697FF4